MEDSEDRPLSVLIVDDKFFLTSLGQILLYDTTLGIYPVNQHNIYWRSAGPVLDHHPYYVDASL